MDSLSSAWRLGATGHDLGVAQHQLDIMKRRRVMLKLALRIDSNFSVVCLYEFEHGT